MQVVILCGGLGTRLRPITNDVPKPMATIDGVPFLWYIIDQVKSQGATSILLLTGYLGEKIEHYIEQIKHSDIKIECMWGPIEWETGERLWNAKDRIEDEFCLLYGDNFAICNLEDAISIRKRTKAGVCLLIQRKVPGNIMIDSETMVKSYSLQRNEEHNYVELGYMSISKKLLFELIERKESLTLTINKLAELKKLSYVVGQGYYYSISDVNRLMLMKEYLRVKRIILIDRDGTINKKPPKGTYITEWDQIEWIEDTISAMQNLTELGFKFIIVTNQAGVARGMISERNLEDINRKIEKILGKKKIDVLETIYCPHHWDEECDCRKPKPGMLIQAALKYKLRLDRTYFIGDDERDVIAGTRAGCRTIFLKGEADRLNQVHNASSRLSSAVEMIVKQFEVWEKAGQP